MIRANPAKHLLTTHGIDLIERPDGRVDAWRGSQWQGYVFPASAAIVGTSGWVARRDGESSQPFPTRHAGLAHIVGGCPDCICTPAVCATDDSGDHCAELNCGYCLNGCPENLCPVGEKASTR